MLQFIFCERICVMKKTLSILLALVLVICLGASAFADGNDGSVTVRNAVPGEIYNIYKIFDLTYSGDGQTTQEGSSTSSTSYEGVAYTYTKKGETDAFLTALQGEGSPFALTESTEAGVYNVSLKTGKTGADIASFLKTNENRLTEAAAAKTAVAATGAETSTVKWENLSYGYYYVTSSLGATVTIDSTLKDVVVEDKNSKPTEDKKQSTDGTSYTDDLIDVSIGDKVYYEVVITNGKGTNKDIKLTDTMTAGLTNNKDYVLYLNSVSAANKLTLNTDYTVTDEGDQGFTITLLANYVKALQETDKIIVRYSATLNENAVTQSEAGANKNTATLEYANQTQTDEVEVTTYKFQLVKDDKNKDLLTGAKFKLFDSQTGGNEIPVVKVSDGVYRVAKADEAGTEIEAGTPVIRGLEVGTYYLEETEAPNGFNRLTERVPVLVSAVTTTTSGDETVTSGGDNLATIQTNKYVTGGVEVVNQSGTELPSTGGIGTTLFYVVGGLLVAGAVVVLVSRKRME